MKKTILFPIIILLAGSVAAWALTKTSLKPSFNHLALSVYDLQKSGDFYQRILNLKRIDDPFKDARHIWLHLGEHSQLHLLSGAPKEQVHPKDVHLSMTVTSVEEFIEHLKKENIPYTGYASDATPTVRADGIKQVYFQDPDGYWIEVNNDKY